MQLRAVDERPGAQASDLPRLCQSKIDVVINNAGIICLEELIENADEETYLRLFHVNVKSLKV